ncbi:MAG TPA: glycosyltransferase family 61 protein [Accumulibacter sp.]|uniref:glycosyltransferase family 61 protein n=1 Tax=Accumulibacter sp. TaxID=2053492 RepID=UPI002C8B4647|nr:glycosyltransferase family 61 protein [Accumulibacter sp.]HRF72548.1 glycosyltransferase family 61 protein [Accumulibacter sp.]
MALLPSQADSGDGEAAALAPAWIPAPAEDEVASPGASSGRIRNVEAVPGKRPDNFARLRESWLGRLYIGHLKPYAAVRWAVQWLWRNGYPIYVNQLATRGKRGQARRWRRLTPLRAFATKMAIRTDQLVPASRVETPEPSVFPADDRAFLASPHAQYEFPEIIVATLDDATTYGGTNLVLVGRDDVVCHDLYDFARDYTSEELHGRTLISPRRRRIRWLLNDEEPEVVPLAATFVDACAGNYAHWLTEVLPRIALFCTDERFKDVPLVVNSGLHANIMESLLLVAGTDREIITLGVGRALTVKQLHLTAAAGYVPFGRRSNRLSGHSHGVFSPPAFERLRHCLTTHLGKAAGGAWPEKIFIRRASGPRMLANSAEIERLMVASGYAIIQPETLSFMQQVRLFANARIVVSPTGAALANAIFCQPGTQVGVFMAKHEEMIYRYWCDMLTPLQIGVSYVLGNLVEVSKLGIHGNFTAARADVADLLEALEQR